MIVAIGVDTIAIERIAAAWRRGGERFLQRLFTTMEQTYCLQKADPAPSLAARFAAKEAVMKCLGTGFGAGVTFASIEVVRDASGAVGIALHGTAAHTAAALGIRHWHLSLTHTDIDATAFAIAER